MEKTLLTRGKSNNSRIPRSTTSAARSSSGSRMRKSVRRSQRIESPCGTAGLNENCMPPYRVWERRDAAAGGTTGLNESCMPRKFARPPSVRAENRLRRKPETARHKPIRLRRPYPLLARLQQKPEEASHRRFLTIVRSTGEPHQCAGVPNASLQDFIAISLFQANKVISILFHRCHTPMIFSIS